MKEKKKRKIRIIIRIILLSLFAAFAIALIITNFFVPVIYLTAYINFKKDVNSSGQMRIRYLDVGFGDCALIELPDGKTMLIDGGTGTYSNVYKILNTLNKSEIDTIDYLICTSVKSEHCGALDEIVKYKNIKNAYIPYVTNIYLTDEYAAFYKQLLKSGADIQIAGYGKGEINEEYGYFFGFLSPSVATNANSEYNIMNAQPTAQNINNASAVFWLEYAGRGFMFLSDVGAEIQDLITDSLRLENSKMLIGGKSVNVSHCTVIKTSNHCASGYVQPFLYDFIEPEAAIISVGKNAQSCPSNTEIANIQVYVENNIYRTDMHGTITVTVNSVEYKISQEKQ